jgi:hypothetical protein
MKRYPALGLAILLAVFYTVLGNNRIDSVDGETMFQVTRALAESGRLDLPPGILAPVAVISEYSTDTEISTTVIGRDGRTYAKYGLGQSLAALPLYYLGLAWRAATGSIYAPRWASTLLSGLVTAITAGLLLILARDLGFPKGIGIALALVFGLCSPAWPYTHTFFSEPLVTFCLALAVLSAVRFARRDQARWLALMGGALGFALLTRINALAALPAFALYLALTWKTRRSPIPVILRQAAAALLPLGVGVGLVLLYNLVRFGALLDFGYRTSNWQTPFYVGLYGLTLSPGKGVLWFMPPVLLGIAGFRPFARQMPHEAWLCGGVVAGYLLFHSPYTYWEGGWCWGPRLLLPALPFVILPMGSLLARRDKKKLVELALALVIVLGLWVQIPAVGSNYARPLQQIQTDSPQKFQNRWLFQPAYSPLIGQWRSLIEVTAILCSAPARAEITRQLAEIQPDHSLLLTDSPAEALYVERLAFLSANLPDFWLVSRPWLHATEAP